jgi:diguanylate cyclase
MMIDIDFFKQVNDSISHNAGDIILREVSKVIGSQIRDMDILSRWGGDEFSVILPQSSSEDAFLVAGRILKAVRQHPFSELVDWKNPITVSIGVAGLPNLKISHAFQLVSAADIALIRAKQKGRNQVDIATNKDISPLIPIL